MENNLFLIHEGKITLDPVIIFTFPTSNGRKDDLINFGVFDSILNENIVIVGIQTRDDECFYSQDLTDDEKIENLFIFLDDLQKVFKFVSDKYITTKIPILFGCSIGGYYAHLVYMMHPNKFHCVSLSGICDLTILDQTINYATNIQKWKKLNPIEINICENIYTKIISCFGMRDDLILTKNISVFYDKLKTWNYVKYYDLNHNFNSWKIMTRDIFKGNLCDFHEFRNEFYA